VVLHTEPFDHCNFTVLDDDTAASPGSAGARSNAKRCSESTIARFRELLLAMSYEDATVRPLLDLEGLKAWLPGRTSGYALLASALGRFDAVLG
jgi:hypothetical protein